MISQFNWSQSHTKIVKFKKGNSYPTDNRTCIDRIYTNFDTLLFRVNNRYKKIMENIPNSMEMMFQIVMQYLNLHRSLP